MSQGADHPPRALVSVYDKTGVVEMAQRLVALGWEIISSGGTAAALVEAGVPVIPVEQVTGAPEMMDGRVKTIHPVVHGGLLADLSNPGHVKDLAERGIVPINLVVSNLYPFRTDPSVEQIDIGGPAMVRAAAKNHERVGVVVQPDDYPTVLGELEATGAISDTTRRRLARIAFEHTSAYDAAIAPADGGADPEAPGSAALRREPPPSGSPIPHRRPVELVGPGQPTPGQGHVVPQCVRRRRRLAAGPLAGG